MNLQLVLRMAWRDWRSGELGLLLIALVVAIGTVTSVSLFVDRLHQALISESANFLAADRYIGSSREIPEEFRDAASARGITFTDTMLFPSMVFASDEINQLVSVKAVAPGYPLRGVLKVSDEPFTPGEVTQELPDLGEIWLDSRLFPSLGISLGDTVEVGFAELKVAKVLTREPDRGGTLFDLGPRLLMRMEDVPATEVVQPGSRISYRLLLKGNDDALGELKDELPLKPNFRWVSIRESSPSIGSALDRAESFLLLGGLLGVLLAGVAVALSAHRYARRHYDHVGILKTLGATANQILGGYVALLTAVGAVSVVLGLATGGALHMIIVAMLGSLIPIDLPMPSARPFLLGSATGFICALAFALPPLLHLKNISPMRVIRRDLGAAPASQYLSYGAAAAGSLFLLIWYSGSLWLTAWMLISTGLALLVFGALATLLLRSGRVVGMQAGSGWRLALAGLQCRHRENVAQILIFGLAFMLLLILLLLRTSLIDEWRSQLPENAPNHFVL
ncbi:MAG: ABC transporter permease, partial [Gammaproteobacteria bacterium]|nr:ABC transporter permease [Gammaproteobacteria bacterium]